MPAELTKVYRTADGRLFEREQRDVARRHDAYLELVKWCAGIAEAGKTDVDVADMIAVESDGLLAILKRNPTKAPE